MPASSRCPPTGALRDRGREQRRQHVTLRAQRELRFRKRAGVADLLERIAQLALHDGHLDHLGDEDGPGQQRGKGETDHDGLDQHVRRLEHRPRRQFAELRSGGLQQLVTLGRRRGGFCRRGCGSRRCGRRRRGSLNGRRLCGRLPRRGSLLNHRRGRRCRRHLLLGRRRHGRRKHRQRGDCSKGGSNNYGIHTSAQ